MEKTFICETELPGQKTSPEQLQMICCRYYIASQFVKGKRVLEVGCGPGLGLGYLASKGARRIIGGDCTQESLRRAREHYKGRIELVYLDAQSLPFKDDCFDVVILFEVIYYLSRPDEFLSECHRVIRRGGALVLCLANKDLPGFRSSSLSIKYLSVPELSALLSKHNYDAKIFGAFPLRRGTTCQKIRAATILLVSKALNLTPQGRSIKKVLNELVLGRTIVLRKEIGERDMVAENFKLVPLPAKFPDFRHQILYAIAHAKNDAA
jgi:ubiquinone/menaquinone biosynthesis C-methylase UbiE